MDAVIELLCAIMVGQATPFNWSAVSVVDWSNLLITAKDQGALPLVYHHLSEQGWPASLPSVLRHALQADYYNVAAQNLLFLQELNRILAAVAQAAPVVVLKGAALGLTLYPSPSLRPLHDLDLLVPRIHLSTAIDAIQRLGYSEQTNLIGGTPATEHHIALQGGPRRVVPVELHWNLIGGDADWRSPPLEWFWQQTEEWRPHTASMSSPAGAGVLQLTPTSNLLYLAAHLMLQHGAAEGRLIWLYDLHLLITSNPERLDWDEVRARARAFHWSAALHAALDATQRCFRTPLPAGVLNALCTDTDAKTAAFVRRKAVAMSSTRSMWLRLVPLEPSARINYAWRAFFPSPSYMRWRYQPHPAWLWPLSYPYRWVGALRDAVRALLQVAKGA
ncbi:MAG: nucleotidyltransferase family protein [Herpetosiphonaceae bacterium]|nr:nucleotidyltransferase family protein [Herpetosiphonaceae bacterium]